MGSHHKLSPPSPCLWTIAPLGLTPQVFFPRPFALYLTPCLCISICIPEPSPIPPIPQSPDKLSPAFSTVFPSPSFLCPFQAFS
uniref:WGS project CBMG000000000 data, contig CS5907-c001697 n=1 Tax=Fusarium acuminatum CS5907 TaxID=1318461 RepID=A0A090M995_9HYPO|nr:unnamed protein product [Fusarium acuminatum CS5907]